MELTNFSYIYYPLCIFAIIVFPFTLDEGKEGLKKSIVASIIIVYLLACVRVSGVDFENYYNAYYFQPNEIREPFYNLLQLTFYYWGVSYQVFSLFIGFVSLYAIKRISTYYSIEFAALLILWFLHLVVIRDFSQVRIGFAMSVALIAVTSRSALKWFFYLVAINIHTTSVFFIGVYEVIRKISKIHQQSHRTLCYVLFNISIIVLAWNIGWFSWIDERVTIYLNWDKMGYNHPIRNMYFFLFHGAILLGSLFFQQGKCSLHINRLRQIQITGLVNFIAFSGLAIFAYRLSNVVLSLYPVLLVYTLMSFKENFFVKRNPVFYYLLAWSSCIPLLLRSGTFGIINYVNLPNIFY